MRVDTGVTCRTRQVLVLAVWNVEVGLWVTVFLRETKVDHVNLVAALSNTHQEVVWFDVTVDEGFGVNVFDPRDELISKE